MAVLSSPGEVTDMIAERRMRHETQSVRLSEAESVSDSDSE